jgi:hypothetical protein
MQLIKSAFPFPTTLDSYLCGTRLGTVFKILALLVLWLGWSMPARAQALVATEGFAEFRAHIEADTGQTFSGGLAQNLDHIYTLTQAQITHLASLGIDAPTLLARMNARRIYTRDPVADAYERAWFNPTGQITGPEILIKDIGDAIVPPAHDLYYLNTVQAAGTQGSVLELFRPEPVPRGLSPDINHQGFFVSQLIQALAAMHAWIATGNRPTPDWASFGFRPFQPKPFPYLPN